MQRQLVFGFIGWALSVGLAPDVARAQTNQEPTKQPAAAEAAPAEPVQVIEIADEPKTIDPATLVPPVLAQKVTVEFRDSSLREVVAWLRDKQQIAVLIDNRALSSEGISLGEPVSDALRDAPIYLLLNRLRSLGLAWYMDDNILHITTTKIALERMSTQPYNVGDLLDKGYDADGISEVIGEATGGSWQDVDGEGGATEVLGDVLFVRQTDEQHQQVRGLLAALRKHGRQTMTLDPPQHLILREKLQQKVAVAFEDTPLETAVAELAKQVEADIRLDAPALRENRVRVREPVTLKLADRSLATVLHVLLSDLDLTWVLRDGVLWVTSTESAEQLHKSAVYDVRDLCRNEEESMALEDALQNQTSGPWEDIVGEGGRIIFPQPGTMVVRQTERGLIEILNLLETYRKALRASKPRDRAADAGAEVITRYYQLQAGIATDLQLHLPELVEPESWKTQAHPEAEGTILRLASTPEKMETFLIDRSVLVIRQKRSVHEKIAAIIGRVQQGDALEGLGGGLGGGGFGGGFFSVPAPTRKSR